MVAFSRGMIKSSLACLLFIHEPQMRHLQQLKWMWIVAVVAGKELMYIRGRIEVADVCNNRMGCIRIKKHEMPSAADPDDSIPF